MAIRVTSNVSNTPTGLIPETPDIESSSADYAGRFVGSVGAYFLEVQTTEVLRMLQQWPKARILDVGGGHAQLAVPLVKRGFDVTVVGSSDSCRSRLDSLMAPESFRFLTCSLLDLPFSAGAFDVVLAFRLLPHVRQWERLIAEMCRVAKSAIVVDYPELRSFNLFSKYLFRAKKAFEGNTRPFRCFSYKKIVAEFSKGGFGSALARPQFFAPMVVHRSIRCITIVRAVETAARVIGLTPLFGSPVIVRVTSDK